MTYNEIFTCVFSYPLAFGTPVRGVPVGILALFLGIVKLEWLGYPTVKKFRRYIHPFWQNSQTWQRDRRTDRHRMTAIAALMLRIARQKCNHKLYPVNSYPIPTRTMPTRTQVNSYPLPTTNTRTKGNLYPSPTLPKYPKTLFKKLYNGKLNNIPPY